MSTARRPAGRTAIPLVAIVALLIGGCQAAPASEEPTGSLPSTTPGSLAESVDVPTTTPRELLTPSPSPLEIRIMTVTEPPSAEPLPEFRTVLITEASYPAGMAVAPDGRIFYSELFDGQIRVLRADGTVDPVPWADVNAEYAIAWTEYYHGGLSGIAFDPDFEANDFVYVVAQVPDADGIPARSLVVRYRERDGRGTEPNIILEVPASRYENIYSLVFGPDGMLYIPSGHSRGRREGTDRLADLYGKILRIQPDGGAPPDNPFGRSAPLVWATGLRNAFDIAFVPGTDLIVAGENGATAHDEINLIMRGHDYGWPAHEGAADAEGMTQPLLDYGDERVAPAGIAHYDGARFPALRGSFLMCHNHGPGLFALWLDADDPGRLAAMTQIADECSVDVIVTPAGDVYFSDARTIYRLEASATDTTR